MCEKKVHLRLVLRVQLCGKRGVDICEVGIFQEMAFLSQDFARFFYLSKSKLWDCSTYVGFIKDGVKSKLLHGQGIRVRLMAAYLN